MTEGRKDDAAKDRFELLPGDALRAFSVILTFGAVKYSDRNWEAGMDWSRCFGALQRHLWAWWEGENKDSETGKSHLWHAGCCILFLTAYEIRGVGRDDRPKVVNPDRMAAFIAKHGVDPMGRPDEGKEA